MDFVLRGGQVLTMDEGLGELPAGDVHVRDGRVAAVGAALDVPGAETVDVTGSIVMPGFVESHWHMWNTLVRADSERLGYFRASRERGVTCTPEDVAEGTRLSCVEALRSGITTVHDWDHNVRGPEHARASLRELARSGLRVRYSYGYAAGHPNDRPMDLADLRRLHGEWAGLSTDGRLSLGMAWRGPGGSDPAMSVPAAVYRQELETARELGLPVSVHASGPPGARGQIRRLAGEGLLGPDIQVVHADNATDEEIELLAGSGAAVSLSPWSELRIGFGFPRTAGLLAAGIRVGLSVDTTALTGNADMFAIMKLTQAVANALARDESAMPALSVVKLATIGGAASLGLGDEIGSLAPGKRADITVVSTGGPNMTGGARPAELLVTAAQPSDVACVYVEGRRVYDRDAVDTANRVT